MTTATRYAHAIDPTVSIAGISRRARIASRLLAGIATLFLLLDSAMKVALIEPVVVTMSQLGWTPAQAPMLGVLQAACLALHLLPRTSVLGAILITGYLGGAVATHVRVGSPLVSHALFPVYVALLLWGALWLRHAGVRALLTSRR